MTCKIRHLLFTVTSFFIVTLFMTLIFPSASQSFADSGNSAIRTVTDLAQDANLARSQGLVILIEFSNDDCAYCRLLENEFLEPMSINQEYREKVMIRSLALNGDRQITGFQGESISVSQFASKYQVMVTPTMVFLDTSGNELSEKLVGIWSLDYFGSYIDERIDAAREKVL